MCPQSSSGPREGARSSLRGARAHTRPLKTGVSPHTCSQSPVITRGYKSLACTQLSARSSQTLTWQVLDVKLLRCCPYSVELLLYSSAIILIPCFCHLPDSGLLQAAFLACLFSPGLFGYRHHAWTLTTLLDIPKYSFILYHIYLYIYIHILVALLYIYIYLDLYSISIHVFSYLCLSLSKTPCEALNLSCLLSGCILGSNTTKP